MTLLSELLFLYKMEILIMAWTISRPGLYTNLFTISTATQFDEILDCMSFLIENHAYSTTEYEDARFFCLPYHMTLT